MMSNNYTRIHHLLDKRCLKTPNKQACIDHDGRRLNFSEFNKATHEAAAQLERAGVRPGDRVMIIGENSVALSAFMLACSHLDAWLIPVNSRITQEEIKRLKDHSEPRAMVFTHLSSTAAAVHGKHFTAQETDNYSFGRVLITGQLQATPEPCFSAAEEQVAALVYTSGTTGNAKGVMLTHNNLLFIAIASIDIKGLTTDDHLYCVLPTTHIYSLTTVFLASILGGSLIEYVPRFDPKELHAALERGVSLLAAVPAMYALLLEYADDNGIEKAVAPRIRMIQSGGAPLDPEWKKRIEAFFDKHLCNGYGMTETSPTVCITPRDKPSDDVSSGPPIAGVEVKLVPPSNDNTHEEGVGEILVRGPNVMKGYYKNPEETAKVLQKDGFFHTGDLGKFNEEGSLSIVGRCKELIIRSGFNVYPAEVEAALNKHPAIVQAAVVGRTLSGGNEEVLAFVQKNPNQEIDEETLKSYLKTELAPYKRPSQIIIAEQLPSAATGKLLKAKMIDHFSDFIR